jgi:SAM-dependent methyltransferase
MSPSPLHQAIATDLRAAYDGSAEARSSMEKAPWQIRVRDAFLARLLSEGGETLFEVGSGAGHDSQHFVENGLSVVATDLSPQMVTMCRRRGLDARVMDVLHLDLPAQAFDAAYAMNSLLHVPNSDLPGALAAIRRALKPGAMFFLGVYGGPEPFEGVLSTDWHVPPRFFSFRTDSQLLTAVGPFFHVEDFHIVEEDRRFQALTLRALAQVA